MRKSTIILGAVLGVSLLVNALTMSRLARVEKPADTAPKSRGAAPAAEKPLVETTAGLSTDAKIDRMIQEMDRLRSEVAALRDTRAPGGTAKETHRGGGSTDAPTTNNNPRVAELMREGGAINQFWKDLGTLSGAKESTKEGEYHQLVLDATADFLGLADPTKAQFVEAAKLAATDLESAGKEYGDAVKSLHYDEKNPQAYQDATQALYNHYLERQNRAKERLSAYLSQENARHKHFTKNFATWLYYVNPSSSVWSYGDGAWGGWQPGDGQDK